MQERSFISDENNNNKHDIDYHFLLNNMKLNHIIIVSYIYIYIVF